MTTLKNQPFDFKTQYGLVFSAQDDEIVVDFFCGGAGTGLEMGLGRPVNVAKNHNPNAISMHTINHPGAVHYTTDVFEGDPDTESCGKAVANLVHLRGNCDTRDANDPLCTIRAGGQHHGLVSAFMERAFGGSVGQGLEEPAPTITAGGGGKSSLVSLTLSPEHKAGALRVAAFLISYYGTENTSACDSPAPTITTKDRLALVTVMVKGTPYVIVDICLRMLKPPELYKAQGFPADYIISHGADGKPFTITQQVHMCGNSVSPPPMCAIAMANDPWQITLQQREAA